MNAQGLYWCFTCNAHLKDDQPEHFLAENDPQVLFDGIYKFLIYQAEIGEHGNLHWQGYVVLKNRMRKSQLVSLAPAFHIEPRAKKSTHSHARDYCCKKDETTIPDTLVILGDDSDVPEKSGQINLNHVKQFIDDGCTLDQLYQEYFHEIILHKSLIEYFHFKNARKHEISVKSLYHRDKVILKTWQKMALDKLVNQDERKILFVIDEVGGFGKSFLAKYIQSNYDTFFCSGGKSADLAYAYNYQEYVIFDIARGGKDYVPYVFMENLKSGSVFSPKYGSITKWRIGVKIMINLNFEPDMTQFSKIGDDNNRYDFFRLGDFSRSDFGNL